MRRNRDAEALRALAAELGLAGMLHASDGHARLELDGGAVAIELERGAFVVFAVITEGPAAGCEAVRWRGGRGSVPGFIENARVWLRNYAAERAARAGLAA